LRCWASSVRMSRRVWMPSENAVTPNFPRSD
ncbi:uncharacterized protein METZ01_LOCUS251172, partial [marine metagenome]